MTNPAQIQISAARRRQIVMVCRVDSGLNIPEIAKAVKAHHRTVRDDVRLLEKLGYLQCIGKKQVRMVDAELFTTVTDMDYPLPHESQQHPRILEKPKPVPLPAGGRLIKFT